jgi:type VI secretion system secreted protein VgrG
MPKYFQAERPLSVKTPLGGDTLLLTGLEAHEGISQLFRFEFDLRAEVDTEVAFDKLLGQKVTAKVQLSARESRHFSGFVSRISQGGHDEEFTEYRMEVVPQFWMLTKRTQSRIFQYMNVPCDPQESARRPGCHL